jgi:hypothetical protein
MGASLDRFHKGVGLALTIDAAFPSERIPKKLAETAGTNATFPSRKVAPPVAEWNRAMGNPL